MAGPKKRDDGEGSAYRMSDGRWRSELTVGWETLPDGKRKRIRKYVYGTTESEAKANRRSLVQKRDAGELPIGADVTVAAWMTHWVEVIAPQRVKVKTLESYRPLINNWINPVIGSVRLTDLAPEHVERLHAAMRAGRERTTSTGKTVPAKPLAAASILQAHRILSRALKVAMQREKVRRNVATLVDAPSVSQRRAAGYLDLAQSRAVMDAARGTFNGERWSVGVAIGIRQGEALGLLWDIDVDLDDAIVRVQRQLQRRRGGTLELVDYPKSRAGVRAIPLPPPLVEALRRHRKAQREMRLALGPGWTGSELGDFVFAQPNGRPIDPRRDWQAWKELLAAAEVPYVKPHGARHTAATLMLIQGVDIKVVQTILGHSQSSITRDLYQHVVPELSRDAADRMGAALWG